MKNRFEEIIDDLVNPSVRLSDILRKASIVASQLKNDEFKEWLRQEQNGYKSLESIPEYRHLTTHLVGQFSGPFGRSISNAPIPFAALPGRARDNFKKMKMSQGISNLEATIAGGEGDTLQANVPADLLPYIEGFEGYGCIGAWNVISKSQVSQILDTVRNRLLTFVLELQEQHPELAVSAEAISNLPPKEVQTIFMTNIINGGVHGSNVALGKSKISHSSASVTLDEREQKIELGELVRRMKNDLPHFDLVPEVYEEATSDIATIEAQLASPHPKSLVVTESLKSLRSISEGTVASVAANYLPLLMHWINQIQVG